jgi:hypothetical protein
MPDYEEGIISVRFRHPTEDRELEVKINAKDMGVDAVFITVDAVNKILMPYYQHLAPAEAEDLRKRVEEQRQGNACVVLHKFSCKQAVPAINWSAKAPIKLGPCDWRPGDRPRD